MAIKRVDNNHRDIVQGLRQAGVLVLDLHEIGHGCPDLLCSYAGVLTLLEVKNARGKLTVDEAEFCLRWLHTVRVVRTLDEALAAIGAVEKVGERG